MGVTQYIDRYLANPVVILLNEEKISALKMGFQVLLLILAAVLLDRTNSELLDKVDSCLFTCDYCFKGEVLLNCANDCLKIEIAGLNPIWNSLCPYFGHLSVTKH